MHEEAANCVKEQFVLLELLEKHPSQRKQRLLGARLEERKAESFAKLCEMRENVKILKQVLKIEASNRNRKDKLGNPVPAPRFTRMTQRYAEMIHADCRSRLQDAVTAHLTAEGACKIYHHMKIVRWVQQVYWMAPPRVIEQLTGLDLKLGANLTYNGGKKGMNNKRIEDKLILNHQ